MAPIHRVRRTPPAFSGVRRRLAIVVLRRLERGEARERLEVALGVGLDNGVAVAAIRIFTNRAIPGWATYSIGTLTIILIQFITIAASFTFTLLSNRINLSFVPLRDYGLVVAGTQDAYHSA